MKVPYLSIVNTCLTKEQYSILIVFNNEKEAEMGFAELCSYLKDIHTHKGSEERTEIHSKKKLYFTDTKSFVIVSTKRKYKEITSTMKIKEVHSPMDDFIP